MASSGAIGDPSTASEAFAADMRLVSDAKKAGATGIAFSTHLKDVAVGLVPVPAGLRTDTSGLLQQFPLSEYVFVLRQHGPGETDQVFPDGHKAPVVTYPTGFVATTLAAGTYVSDPVLGGIWRVSAQYDCKDFPKLQSICSAIAG
jgi:hypothetical protein